MRDKVEEILVILSEECSELIKEVSKVQRFGLTNQRKMNLESEIADILCMVEMLIGEGAISAQNFEAYKLLKRDKLKGYSTFLK